MSSNMGYNEFGVSYLYKGDQDLGGSTVDELKFVQRQVKQDVPDGDELVDVIEEIIDLPAGSQITRQMRENGRFLLKARGVYSPIPLGLMFVEGLEKDKTGAFSVINAAFWTISTRATHTVDDFKTKMPLPDAIRYKFEIDGFRNIDISGGEDEAVGVPVSNLTLVNLLHPRNGDITNPYLFGFKPEFQTIQDMHRVSDDTKRHLSQELITSIRAEEGLI